MVQMLDESGQDVDAALQRYERERHPEILALHSMDLASTAWSALCHAAKLLRCCAGQHCSSICMSCLARQAVFVPWALQLRPRGWCGAIVWQQDSCCQMAACLRPKGHHDQ